MSGFGEVSTAGSGDSGGEAWGRGLRGGASGGVVSGAGPQGRGLGGGATDLTALSLPAGPRPFQCRYCPYSASQKGNLKTHVLCVHRMPFDNSQYPDRRFKRSRVDAEAAGSFEELSAAKAGGSELPEEGGQAQEERN